MTRNGDFGDTREQPSGRTAVPSRLTRRRLAIGTAVQMGVRVLGVASGVLVAAVLARSLGHTNFGRFSLALSLVGIAASFGELGLASSAVRHIAITPSAEARTAGALVAARAVSGVIGALAVSVLVMALDDSAEGRRVGLLIAGALAARAAYIPSARRSGEAPRRSAESPSRPSIRVVDWRRGGSRMGSCAIRSLRNNLPGRYFGPGRGCLVARSSSTTSVTFIGALEELKKIAKIAAPVAVGVVFVTAYYRLDGILLYRFGGPGATADYTAAYRFLDVLQVVPSTLLGVVFPLLAATWRRGDAHMIARRDRLFRLTMSVIVAAGAPIALGGSLLSPAIVGVIYGSEFSQAGALLSVLLLAFPAISMGYVAVGLALASGRTVLFAWIAAIAAVCNVGACLLFLPNFGATAAAYITVVTEYAANGLLLIILARDLRVRPPWRSWVGTLAALLVMAPVYSMAASKFSTCDDRDWWRSFLGLSNSVWGAISWRHQSRHCAKSIGRRMRKTDVVCLATADWDAELWTNKQHLMSRLALHGHRVLYVDSLGLRAPALSSRDVRRVVSRLSNWHVTARQVSPQLLRDSPIVLPFSHTWAQRLNRFLLTNRFKRNFRRYRLRAPVLWTYTPAALQVFNRRDYSALIYHCVDDLGAYPGIDRDSFRRQEAALVATADVCIASSPPWRGHLKRRGQEGPLLAKSSRRATVSTCFAKGDNGERSPSDRLRRGGAGA